MPGVPLDVMDKLKAIFRRKSKQEGSATAGTKTETPAQSGTPTQVPEPTPTQTAPAPSSSEPVAPAGAAPTTTMSGVDNTPAAPQAGQTPLAATEGHAAPVAAN